MQPLPIPHPHVCFLHPMAYDLLSSFLKQRKKNLHLHFSTSLYQSLFWKQQKHSNSLEKINRWDSICHSWYMQPFYNSLHPFSQMHTHTKRTRTVMCHNSTSKPHSSRIPSLPKPLMSAIYIYEIFLSYFASFLPMWDDLGIQLWSAGLLGSVGLPRFHLQLLSAASCLKILVALVTIKWECSCNYI